MLNVDVDVDIRLAEDGKRAQPLQARCGNIAGGFTLDLWGTK